MRTGKRRGTRLSKRLGVKTLVLISLAIAFGPIDPSVAAPDAIDAIVGGVTATQRAERGTQVQLTQPPLPPEPACRRVGVIGDSLTANGQWWHQQELNAAGFESRIDAQPSRRIPGSVRPPYSGVVAARQIRATWGEADCWVIALGSNDLIYGGGVVTTARQMIAEQLGALTPGARVWWVNVDYHRDPRTPFDFGGATRVFNAEVARTAAEDPFVELIDWYTVAERHLDWFFDPVHVDRTGSIARAVLVVSALPR